MRKKERKATNASEGIERVASSSVDDDMFARTMSGRTQS